jgi:GABA(A) receptor-associated protein
MYKLEVSFQLRKKETSDIMKKYPDRIPIICEKHKQHYSDNVKRKYLVPKDYTLGQFIHVVREKICLTKEQALFFSVGSEGCMPSCSSSIQQLYDIYGDKDGYLYMSYMTENVFGRG